MNSMIVLIVNDISVYTNIYKALRCNFYDRTRNFRVL